MIADEIPQALSATIFIYEGATGISCEIRQRLARAAVLAVRFGVGVPPTFQLHDHGANRWFTATVTGRSGQQVHVDLSPSLPPIAGSPGDAAEEPMKGKIAFGSPVTMLDCALQPTAADSFILELPVGISVPDDALAFIDPAGKVIGLRVLQRHYPKLELGIITTDLSCAAPRAAVG